VSFRQRRSFAQRWEAEVLSLAAAAVDGHGRGVGLPPDPAGDRIRDEVALTLFPRSFEVVEPVSSVHRFRLAPKKEAPPLPDWWGDAALEIERLALA
jgi:hypothetical protein